MRVNPAQSEVSIFTYGSCVKSATRLAPNCDYVIDVAGLRDPLSNRGFRHQYKDGRNGEVQKFVMDDPRFGAILDIVKLLSHCELRANGGRKAFIAIAFRDHHGLWIAPAVAEAVADALDRDNYKVSVYHTDIEGAKK